MWIRTVIRGVTRRLSMWIRTVIFLYTLLWFFLLIGVVVLYLLQPHVFGTHEHWQELAAVSVWFAMLGGVAISFKGIYDHYQRAEWATGGWTLWYLGRPVSGAIVGVMSYVLLRVLNSNDPLIPTLAVAAFTLGTQEKRFFTFLAEVAKLVLTVPGEAQPSLLIKNVLPDHGAAGIPVLVVGQGIREGARVALGGVALVPTVVSPDGTSAAGIVPAAVAPGPVDVVVTNPDGTARSLAGGFTRA